MRNTQLLLWLLLGMASLLPLPLGASDNQRGEQTRFGAEGDFEKPVPLASEALDVLRYSASPEADNLLAACAQEADIAVMEIPPSWFAASSIALTGKPGSGLVVRAENWCLNGAHIAQFWVLAKRGTGYRIVFNGRADGFRVLSSRTNGYRNLELTFFMAAGANVEHVKLRYAGGEYRVTKSASAAKPD